MATNSPLAGYFNRDLRLVGLIGLDQAPLGAEETITAPTIDRFTISAEHLLRADLMVVATADSQDSLKQLSACTHEAGHVYLTGTATKLAGELKKLGWVATAVKNLYRKPEAATPEEYGEDYIGRWGDTDFLANSALAAAQILAHIPKGLDKATMKILDVGCLNCYIMESLHRAGAKQVFGTDISYALAVKHCLNPYHLPAITVGDFSQNDYPAGCADMTICMEVLEHIPPDLTDKFVSELARVTSQHGILLISTSESWEADETHINCRNRAQWYYELSKYGLVPTGSQVIFPGFNSFVVKKASAAAAGLWRVVCRIRLAYTGPLKPRAQEVRHG